MARHKSDIRKRRFEHAHTATAWDIDKLSERERKFRAGLGEQMRLQELEDRRTAEVVAHQLAAAAVAPRRAPIAEVAPVKLEEQEPVDQVISIRPEQPLTAAPRLVYDAASIHRRRIKPSSFVVGRGRHLRGWEEDQDTLDAIEEIGLPRRPRQFINTNTSEFLAEAFRTTPTQPNNIVDFRPRPALDAPQRIHNS